MITNGDVLQLPIIVLIILRKKMNFTEGGQDSGIFRWTDRYFWTSFPSNTG